VLIVRFASGLRLVYKPRSLAVEASFQRLLAWVNGCGTETPFRVLRVLDRGGHGWMEFVEAGPCQTAAEVRRFYRRQGGYLALLYALAATDFHHENVIAAGEHPVLVDLEALFHRRPADADSDPVRSGVKEGVLAVMLLPRLYFSEKSDNPIDLSGLGAPDGQPAPFGTPTWEHSGGDDMRLMFRPGTLATGQNRPTLRGAEVDLPEYARDLEAGFTSIYELMCRRRGELAERVAAFGGHEVRFIARPTQAYATLLNLCTHPDRLRDPLERDCCIDRLWVHAEEDPCLKRLVEAERADLLEGDIPVFRTRPDSRDLWTSRGERIVDFFDQTGVDLVRQRLARLGEGDLTRQRWVIRAAQGLQAAYSRRRKGHPQEEGTPAVSRPDPTLPRGEMMAAARRVGESLEALAWRQNGEAGWAGLIPNDPHGWTIAPLTLDLGEGLPGVVVFLAYLGEATGEPRFTALARAGLAGVRRRVAERPPTDEPTVQGLACMLAHLARLWDDPAGRNDVLALSRRLPAAPRSVDLREVLDAEPRRKVAGVEVPDLRGGLAGTGLAWLMLADPELVSATGTPVALSLGE
jgi:type 2 lantibiotic biosynthesis protein LanM